MKYRFNKVNDHYAFILKNDLVIGRLERGLNNLFNVELHYMRKNGLERSKIMLWVNVLDKANQNILKRQERVLNFKPRKLKIIG